LKLSGDIVFQEVRCVSWYGSRGTRYGNFCRYAANYEVASQILVELL